MKASSSPRRRGPILKPCSEDIFAEAQGRSDAEVRTLGSFYSFRPLRHCASARVFLSTPELDSAKRSLDLTALGLASPPPRLSEDPCLPSDLGSLCERFLDRSEL